MSSYSYTFFRLIGTTVAALAVAGVSHAQSPVGESSASARCTGWTSQGGPESDTTGIRNINYPEASSTTYWGTPLLGTMGQKVTIHGQFPFARFTSLEVYTGGGNAGGVLIDHIADVNIVPNPGQNNPYVSGTANGFYTAYVVFGPKPAQPAQNTIYTGTNTSVTVAYRIYHSTDPNDPAAGATTPVLPLITVKGKVLSNCAVRPFLPDPLSTPWGRLASSDFIGSAPTAKQALPVTYPAVWTLTSPYGGGIYFPNGADGYMGTVLSREFLAPNTKNNLYVVRYRSPTFPNTRAGEPVYLDRQVHFWSFCTDDPYTTNANRCIPDDQSVIGPNGFVTFVVSDPGSKPNAAAMQAFSATWIPWGALDLPTDVVYDRTQRAWGINTPVHYYNALIIRQTDAAATFTQSYQAVMQLPIDQQAAAMGDYWPVGGYCSTADFNSYGAACVGK